MKYFINRNIFKDGVTTEDSEYSSNNKLLWIFLPLGVAILIEAAIIALTKNFIMGIPAGIALLIAYIYIERKKVFDENEYKKMVANNSLNKEMKISNFNNILNVGEDGQLYFQTNEKGLTTAYIVTFDYSSLTDETQNANINTIQDAFVPFFKELWLHGFDFSVYDIKVSSEISEGTLNLISKSRNLDKDEWLKMIITIQNETISNLEQNGSSKYKIYFEVRNSNIDNVSNFYHILENIINKTLNTQNTINNARIIKGREISIFLSNYFLMPNVNLKDRNIKNVSVEKLFHFISFGDTFGNEYSIDIFDPEFTNSSNNKFDINERYENSIRRKVDKIYKKQNINSNKQLEDKINKEKEILLKKKMNITSPDSTLNKTSKQEQLKKKEEEKRARIEKQQKAKENNLKNKNDKRNMSFQDLLNGIDKK